MCLHLDVARSGEFARASHVFAIREESKQVDAHLYLINLDADNIMNPQWLRTMFEQVTVSLQDPNHPISKI